MGWVEGADPADNFVLDNDIVSLFVLFVLLMLLSVYPCLSLVGSGPGARLVPQRTTVAPQTAHTVALTKRPKGKKTKRKKERKTKPGLLQWTTVAPQTAHTVALSPFQFQ